MFLYNCVIFDVTLFNPFKLYKYIVLLTRSFQGYLDKLTSSKDFDGFVSLFFYFKYW